MQRQRLYYFTFSDKLTKRIETLQVIASTFSEALPRAFVHRHNLNKQHPKSNWDVVGLADKDFYNER